MKPHLSGVFVDHLHHGLHSVPLVQQLQPRGVGVRDVPQPVLPVVISSVLFTGQQGFITAGIHWDLWSGMCKACILLVLLQPTAAQTLTKKTCTIIILCSTHMTLFLHIHITFSQH